LSYFNLDLRKTARKLIKFVKHPVLSCHDIYLKRYKLKGHDDIQKNLNQLISFKQYYPVNDLMYKDEHLWPYLRNHLWANINSVSLGSFDDYILRASRIQGTFFEDFSPKIRNKLQNNSQLVQAKNFKNLIQTDILFFVMQNATEKLERDGLISHKYIDYYYKAASELTTVQKYEVIRTSNLAEDWDRYEIPAKLLVLSKKFVNDFSAEISYDKSLFNCMRENIPILKTLTKKDLLDILNYELSARLYYIELLKAINPKVVFLNFYHRYAPLISAAEHLGILTVDLQHGIQRGWTPLYNRFEEVSNRSYQALPDYFAVYSKLDVQNIEYNFRSKSKHRPLLMGYSWLNESTISRESRDSYLDFLENLCSGQKIILFVLQKQRELPQYLLNVIKSTSNKYTWLIRHHPKGHKFKILDFDYLDNVIINDLLDQMPLNILASKLDISVSEGSALSYELKLLGIKGLIIGQEGKDNYTDEIVNKELYYAHAELESIIGRLAYLEALESEDNNRLMNDISARKFIENILKLSSIKNYEKF